MRPIIVTCLGILALTLAAGRAAAQLPAYPVRDLALQLRETNPVEIRRGAAFTLKFAPDGDIGPAVQGLIDALKDPDQIVRANAADALALITPGNVVPELTKALLLKEQPLIRQGAADVLGRIKRYTSEALPNLILLLNDPVPEVRTAATWALRQILGDTFPGDGSPAAGPGARQDGACPAYAPPAAPISTPAESIPGTPRRVSSRR
jgi:HEAT repeat protein